MSRHTKRLSSSLKEISKDKNKLAIKFYEKAKKINPNNQQIYENIIICNVRLKNFEWVEKKIIELNTLSVEHKIQFPEFLVGKKINPYFCDEFDNEGDILFYKRGPSPYISGDHWGGPIANVTFIEAEKKIKINYSVYSEDELTGNNTLIIQFGNKGEVLLNGRANKQFICDKAGSLSSYIFNEKDFIKIN